MHTSSGVDNVDEFAETIVPRTASYSTATAVELRPVTIATMTLSYKTPTGHWPSATSPPTRTHHGPIVREGDGKWIAFALMNRPVAALEQSFLRTKATDYASFMKVAALKANSSNNTIFADSKGEIAYLHPAVHPDARQPLRLQQAGGRLDPATDWQGLHALDEPPHLFNPANGWVFNTNNWPCSAAGADSPRRADFPATWIRRARTRAACMPCAC